MLSLQKTCVENMRVSLLRRAHEACLIDVGILQEAAAVNIQRAWRHARVCEAICFGCDVVLVREATQGLGRDEFEEKYLRAFRRLVRAVLREDVGCCFASISWQELYTFAVIILGPYEGRYPIGVSGGLTYRATCYALLGTHASLVSSKTRDGLRRLSGLDYAVYEGFGGLDWYRDYVVPECPLMLGIHDWLRAKIGGMIHICVGSMPHERTRVLFALDGPQEKTIEVYESKWAYGDVCESEEEIYDP